MTYWFQPSNQTDWPTNQPSDQNMDMSDPRKVTHNNDKLDEEWYICFCIILHIPVPLSVIFFSRTYTISKWEILCICKYVFLHICAIPCYIISYICIYVYILFVFSFAFIILYWKHLHITTLWHRYFRGPPPLWTDLRCCRQSGRSCSSSRPSGNIDSLTFLINSGFTYSFGNSSTLT